MESPDKITFFASYYEALAGLEPLDRCALYDAIFEYAFCGVEPCFDGEGERAGYLRMAWKLMKPNVDSSLERGRTAAANAKSRKSEREANASQTQANARQAKAKPKRTRGKREPDASETEANESESQAKRSGRSGFASQEKDKEKEVDRDEEEETARARMPSCLGARSPGAYGDTLFGGKDGRVFDVPIDALEAALDDAAPHVDRDSLMGQLSSLCPPGCDGSPPHAVACYRMAMRALGRYDPQVNASPYALIARIFDDERGWASG